MKKTAYIRVSTENQSYDRQLHDFHEYFKSHGINPAEVEIVSEKITSHTKFTERKIYKVLKDAQPGDIIYACQLDRFGRSVSDVLALVDFAMEKGVELITLDGHKLENKTPMGRMVLTMLAAFAEMERTLRAERCQSGTDSAIEEIKKNGYRIARSSGKKQTKWGNEKGCDMSAAYTAAARSHTDRKIAWRENSPAFKWAMDKVSEGMPRKEIIKEFKKLHELQPDVFCTPSGVTLSAGVLSYWIKDSRII